MSKLRSHLTYANVGVTLALVLATTGFAVASIPGRAGVVSACYQRTSGSLRVIDSAKRGSVGKCRKSEKPLSWNQQGPQGLQGGRGVQGLPGVQGVQGSTGLNGGQGVKGDTGAPGPPASRIDGEVLGPVSRQVLSVAGLTLTASCTPISKPASITINAATDANGARFEINSLRTVDGATPPTPLQSGWVLSTAAPTPVFTDAFTNTTDSVMDGGGTFVYHKSSETVTGTFHYFLQNGGGECDLQGNAVPSP